MAEEESLSLEFTPTWVVAVVCFVIILISLFAARGLHYLGKYLDKKNKKLYEALEKLKEELMLLGFISLLLTVFQDAVSHICISSHLASLMLPCKETLSHTKHSLQAINIRRQLLSTNAGSEHCSKGRVPFLSLEALHQLHIFIFVLAVVHVVFCVTTMVLGVSKMSQWKSWEASARDKSTPGTGQDKDTHRQHHLLFISKRAFGYWRKSAVVSWLISFFKQFHNSVSKSDYIALRQGFITANCPGHNEFNFHGYMVRVIERDFRKVVGISWYLWLFVVIFLLLNLEGWHTYFWLAFLPLILLLLVGAKLEHIITRMAQDVDQNKIHHQTGLAQDVDQNKIHHQTDGVDPSDKYFWFGRPGIVLDLIHFILFQNSFEIAFFIWIWCTYGFHSCMMEKLGYIIPRLIISVIVQVLCSYSTLPLYALVGHVNSPVFFVLHMHTLTFTRLISILIQCALYAKFNMFILIHICFMFVFRVKMGSKFRFDTFNEFREASSQSQARQKTSKMQESNGSGTQMQKMNRESYEHVQVAEEIVVIEAATS